MMRRLVLTETASGLTYTAQTSVPVGARILDVLIETFTDWTAASLAIDVGDSDATDALVAAFAAETAAATFVNGSVISSGTAWGDAAGLGHAYTDGGTGKLYPSGDLITVVGTATVPGGPTGLTYVTLLMELPGVVRQSVVT